MAPKPSPLVELLRQRASEISEPMDVLASIRAQATLGQYVFADDAAAVARDGLDSYGDIEALLIERAVMRVIAADLKASGWLQETFDPAQGLDRWEEKGSVEFFKGGEEAWIELVPGNGIDVLADYSINVSDLLPRYRAMWDQITQANRA